jgi:serine/threonine-protein kinase
LVSGVASPRSADALTAGQRIGPYLLLAPLGTGGSSRVWAVARTGQQGFSKRMALKVMRQDRLSSERARQRFDLEARMGAQLRHSNLRAVHELGSHDGRPHMALAWVDTSLEELLEHAPDKRLEADVVCWFGIQACAALAAAHSHVNPAGCASPIVHGDVSPGNILLTMSGHVLLADLAAAVEPSPASPEQGCARSFFGCLGYAAPEAVNGARVDGRADLFSLGCVLYEMLAGAPAFQADDERSLLFQVLKQGPIALAERAPHVPEPLTLVVQRALERNPDDRFGSADEMRQALCACVPTRNAFQLERRSTELMSSVLGERVRQREEQMRLTFQRFTTAQLERTDTLPIGNAMRRREGTTLHSGAAEAPPSTRREAPVSIPGGVVAIAAPRQRRRAHWLVLAALTASLGGYGAWSQRARPGPPAAAALPGPPSGQPAPEPSRELRGLQPDPIGPGSGMASPGSGRAGPASTAPETQPKLPPSTTAPALPATQRAPARRNARASRDAPSAAEQQRALPAPSVRKWKLPGNPYKDAPTPAPLRSSPTR